MFVDDFVLPARTRYMESFESKHSNHTLSAGIAQEIGLELPSLRLDSQAKYGEWQLVAVDGWVGAFVGVRLYLAGLMPRWAFSHRFWHTHHLQLPPYSTHPTQCPPPLLSPSPWAGALSRGDASIFMRFPPADYREKIWDHAAGSIVVEEAGGKISDATGG